MTDIFEMELEDEGEMDQGRQIEIKKPTATNNMDKNKITKHVEFNLPKTSSIKMSHNKNDNYHGNMGSNGSYHSYNIHNPNKKNDSHFGEEEGSSQQTKKSPRLSDKSSPGGSSSHMKDTGRKEVTEILGFEFEASFDTSMNTSSSSFKENDNNTKMNNSSEFDFIPNINKTEDRDKNYMRSKMMYFNRLNVGRSDVKPVNIQRTSPENITCKSAPQSTPIPILYDGNSHKSIFDPQLVVNTLSTTFIPPHEMINRSEFSVWEKDRKKIPKKYHFN